MGAVAGIKVHWSPAVLLELTVLSIILTCLLQGATVGIQQIPD